MQCSIKVVYTVNSTKSVRSINSSKPFRLFNSRKPMHPVDVSTVNSNKCLSPVNSSKFVRPDHIHEASMNFNKTVYPVVIRKVACPVAIRKPFFVENCSYLVLFLYYRFFVEFVNISVF